MGDPTPTPGSARRAFLDSPAWIAFSSPGGRHERRGPGADAHPRAAGPADARPRGQPRLVQGELAAGEDDRGRAARLRSRAEQHLLQRAPAASPAACTPSPGTSSSRWPPAASSPPGWTCGRARASARTSTLEIDPSVSVFVPRGVANGYQALEDGTAYTYLVNDHWRPGLAYAALDLGDPMRRRPLADRPRRRRRSRRRTGGNPRLDAVTPMATRRTLILGGRGQVGRAFAAEFPDAVSVDLDELDLTDPAALAAWPWQDYDVVLNAAGYTAVDAAETPEGRRGVLGRERHRCPPGSRRWPRSTASRWCTSPPTTSSTAPRSATPRTSRSRRSASTARARPPATSPCPRPRHYLLRTSWVVGDGTNFVRTMQRPGPATASPPSVVDDQVGRLTFTTEIARATRHLLDTAAPYGTYNVTNDGPPTSWADVARDRLHAARALPRRRHPRHHRGVRRGHRRSRPDRATACSTSDACAPPASTPRTPRWSCAATWRRSSRVTAPCGGARRRRPASARPPTGRSPGSRGARRSPAPGR